ncbi:MAG: helix-turn-helix domain-containing protein [Butyrivibrio sp.]|nr:helix-turn-helix domain-containing protein [Butyrivibrio sp.]
MVAGLPDKLKQLRLQNHYSQKELSDLLGLSPSIISGYEIGDKTPSLEIFMKISSLYHVSADFLLGISNKQKPTLIDATGLAPEEIKSLHILIDAIKKGHQ